MSSLLYQEIREKRGLAYDVYSSLSPFIDSGLFTVYLATSYTQASVAISLIEDTVSKLRKDLLTEDELQKVKDNLKGTIWLGADDMEMRMSNIAKNEVFFGQNVPISAICERIDAVTPRDIRRVARKLFIPARRSVLAVGPKDGIRALSKKRRLRRIFGTA